jgi:hypothetical protein
LPWPLLERARIAHHLGFWYSFRLPCIPQAQSAAGAVPHLLGIFTGHIYHFFSIVWPQLGGRRYLTAPGTLKAAFNPEKKAASKKPKKSEPSVKSEPAAAKSEVPKKKESSKGPSKAKKAKKTKK